MAREKHQKLAQAVAYILRDEPSYRMNYMRLIKLLYIANRESLRETGETITHSRFAAMERGPVLEDLYDFIRGQCEEFPVWQEFFRTQNYELVLREDPGSGKLCGYETKLLRRVKENYKDYDEWDLVKETQDFPEWKENEPSAGTSRRIPPSSVLKAVGRSDDEEWIKEQAEARRFLEKVVDE
jgi:uncharacterized phage-associated protein